MTAYSWARGSGYCSHRFCSKCGTSLFIMLPESKDPTVCINTRTLTGLDLTALNLIKGDGWGEMSPQYEV